MAENWDLVLNPTWRDTGFAATWRTPEDTDNPRGWDTIMLPEEWTATFISPNPRKPRVTLSMRPFIEGEQIRVRCDGVTIRPGSGRDEVTAADLRNLPFDTFKTRATSQMPEIGGASALPEASRPLTSEERHEVEASMPSGRRYLTRPFLAGVARVYTTALARGEMPTKAVMQHFGLENRSTATRWLDAAEKAGLINRRALRKRQKGKGKR